jgi:hypothetical protein
VNCRISQNPKIATTFVPGIIGSTSPVFFMLSAIILAPASPKPKASNAPIFTMVYSRMTVSYGPSSLSYLFLQNFFQQFVFLFASSSLASIASASFSSSYAAYKGLLAILLTFRIIASIGAITKSLASFEKNKAPAARTKQTKNVLHMLRPAVNLVSNLISKIETNELVTLLSS